MLSSRVCVTIWSVNNDNTPLKEWLGKNVIQANIRAKYHLNVLAVKNTGGDISMPGVEYTFNDKDHLIVMGQQKDLDKLF